MIPFLEKAQEGGFAVIICNPNTNRWDTRGCYEDLCQWVAHA
jgi:hypothetical protein